MKCQIFSERKIVKTNLEGCLLQFRLAPYGLTQASFRSLVGENSYSWTTLIINYSGQHYSGQLLATRIGN